MGLLGPETRIPGQECSQASVRDEGPVSACSSSSKLGSFIPTLLLVSSDN